jgi:hypothetical protein
MHISLLHTAHIALRQQHYGTEEVFGDTYNKYIKYFILGYLGLRNLVG